MKKASAHQVQGEKPEKQWKLFNRSFI